MLQSLDAPTTTISRDVMSAAALLDTIRPGWAQMIDRDALHLSSCWQCVLGQVFGHYDEGKLRVHAALGSGALPFDSRVFADNTEYRADWIAAIAARVAA